MQHVMLDLETMGTSPNAPIVAIGAVFFDEYSVGTPPAHPSFYCQVSLQSSVDAGCTMDPDTVLWWLKQADDARKAVYDTEKALTLEQALQSFSNWMTHNERAKYVWGNGSDFDNVILRGAYDKIGLAAPWSKFNNRCYRTMKSRAPSVKLVRSGTHHNALDDAISQANHLVNIFAHFRSSTVIEMPK